MTTQAQAPVSHESARTYEDGLGGHITILQEGDVTTPMRFRMIMPKGFGPPAPERHPSQREDFRVLRGTLDLGKVNGKRVVLQAGETFTLPAGIYHLPSNGGEGDLEFEATLTPGLDSAAMFASLYEATRLHTGLGRFARVAMVFRRHRNAIAFPPPVAMVMRVVAGIARGLGLRVPTP
jgi:mannose-6-phosphate isomerase-like protein (cupin superfamily)